MFLDLDHFKLVNDTLGHTVGDELLQAVAHAARACVRADDTVARMGGDEFTVLLDRHQRSPAPRPSSRRSCSTRSRSRSLIDGHELYVTTSIGIALYPDDGSDAETLLKHADSAMYRAKEPGRNNFQFATPTSPETAPERLTIERSLHHAFEREEFVVHYQPMIEPADRQRGRRRGADSLEPSGARTDAARRLHSASPRRAD